MPKNALRFLMGAVLSVALVAPAMAADTYKLDASHTAITWHISHFGFSSPSGKFMNVDGTVTLDEKNPAASSVKLTVPIADMNSGVPKLDEHLKTADFFDAATYPTATFASDKVEATDKDTATVHGNLTLHGVTKPIELKVRLNKLGENMMKLKTAGFSATGTLKRSDFGITKYVPALGDEVLLDIESEANLVAQ
jgi:polyisoprenoid-binding protein YceI